VSITPLRGRLELVAAQLHNPQEAERTGHGRLAGAAWCLSPPRAPRGARNPKKATFVTAIRAHQNFPRTPRVRQTFPTAIPHSPPTFGTFLTDSYICARFVVMDIVHLPAHSREARIQVLLKMPRSNRLICRRLRARRGPAADASARAHAMQPGSEPAGPGCLDRQGSGSGRGQEGRPRSQPLPQCSPLVSEQGVRWGCYPPCSPPLSRWRRLPTVPRSTRCYCSAETATVSCSLHSGAATAPGRSQVRCQAASPQACYCKHRP
jgi:hypothetical protein